MLDKRYLKYFKYKVSDEQFIENLNKRYPISLKNNQELVQRVSDRYPYLSKYKTSLIIKEAFYLIRELLFLNKVIHLATFIPYFYLIVTKRITKLYGKIIRVQVKTATPRKIKQNEN